MLLIPTDELQSRLDWYRQDFEKHTGKPFQHFFCPILHIDEECDRGKPGELIRGHIIPKPLGGTLWVPQRKDVDNFYGYIAEADFGAAVRDRQEAVADMVRDSTMARQHRPYFELDGERIRHYTPSANATIPAAHTYGKLVGVGYEVDIVLKVSPDDLFKPGQDEVNGHLIVDQDYRPVATASALKAAHLTCFRLFGYPYVLSYAGKFVSDILGSFFRDCRSTPTADMPAALGRHFQRYYSMMYPICTLPGCDVAFQGTANDGLVTHCIGMGGRVFAVGIILRAGNDVLTVFLPGQPEEINTYFSFLNEPPRGITVRTGPLFPIGGDPSTEKHIPLGVDEQSCS